MINFGNLETPSPEQAPTVVTPSSPGITLNMQKNTVFDLTKHNPGLKNVTMGCGWDVSNTVSTFDLDIAAFLLHPNGKILTADDVIYFNHKESSGIKLMGDNLTGAGDGDDEQMVIDLSKINNDIVEIVFTVNIYDAINKRQTFGMVNSSYIHLLDSENNNREICRYELKNDYSTETALIFARLKRDGSEWQFEAIGEGQMGDLQVLLQMFQ